MPTKSIGTYGRQALLVETAAIISHVAHPGCGSARENLRD